MAPESSLADAVRVDPASFRDPSGFVYHADGVLLRQVNQSYAPDYDHLVESGLYDELSADGLLIPHVEVDVDPASESCYRTLRPERVRFITHPFEWCFGQLKDAALLTLEIERRALARGMTLKDASAYNVQFRNGRPVLIDSLSFQRHVPGQPWLAYRQFCQHFLAPLALWARVDARTVGLLRSNIDGIPLDLASSLLPRSSWLRFGELVHVHLHARSLARYRHTARAPGSVSNISESARLGMIDSLKRTVTRLSWKPAGTPWADYESTHNYSAQQHAGKKQLVEEYLRALGPVRSPVWDLGSNTGDYANIAARLGHDVVAFDLDPAAVEINYRRCRSEGTARILPLVQDLTNPSAGIGWAHRERGSLRDRGPAGAVMALALVHHIAIGNNVPLPAIAEFLASLSPSLIIEFVPKTDEQARRLLASRIDIFTEYSREHFEAAFGACFELRRREPIADSARYLYLFERSAG